MRIHGYTIEPGASLYGAALSDADLSDADLSGGTCAARTRGSYSKCDISPKQALRG